MSFTGIEITGLDALQDVLKKVTPRHANNLMRNTIRTVAAGVRKDIIQHAPKATGDMSSAKHVKVKMRRAVEGAQIAEVIFDAKAFYWRFVEHGTGGKTGVSAQPFVYPARNRAVAVMDQLILSSFSKTLEKTMKRELKKQAKQ